jgi:hypothetical protein
LDWLKGVPRDFHVHIVQKGEEPNSTLYNSISRRENLGREPESYLAYIIENYKDLEGEYFFTQGKPFDHDPEFITHLGQEFKDFRWLGMHDIPDMTSLPDGKPQHPGLDIHGLHRVFEDGELPKQYPFKSGAILAVTAPRIRSVDISIYKKLLKLMPINDNAWAMERLWNELWGVVE